MPFFTLIVSRVPLRTVGELKRKLEKQISFFLIYIKTVKVVPVEHILIIYIRWCLC